MKFILSQEMQSARDAIYALLNNHEKEWRRRWTWNPKSQGPLAALQEIDDLKEQIDKKVFNL